MLPHTTGPLHTLLSLLGPPCLSPFLVLYSLFRPQLEHLTQEYLPWPPSTRSVPTPYWLLLQTLEDTSDPTDRPSWCGPHRRCGFVFVHEVIS